ncbi:hypothetical protein [Persephonella sp.]
MKIFLKGLALSILSLSVIACSSSTPKCSDRETKDLVIEIVKDQLLKIGFGGVIDKLEMKVENIRTIEYQKDVDKYMCKAEFILKNKENNQQNVLPITYTVQKTDDGEKFYVEVYGL